jgi:hypothetical protein
MRPASHYAARIVALVVLSLAVAMPAVGQAPYPNRPIKIIVPYTPGTGIDILAKIEKLPKAAPCRRQPARRERQHRHQE